ncbi:unnamed protein product [Hydatigera taeniaeformis]|uniref:Uncharacterized protein n=1 Tax=Hydatigena taeniaeformis TaxID=6205 RepID=A0A3P7EJA1_HYDTA|nr:unnamed protein product [Hydatigera taeniaeformis]
MEKGISELTGGSFNFPFNGHDAGTSGDNRDATSWDATELLQSSTVVMQCLRLAWLLNLVTLLVSFLE